MAAATLCGAGAALLLISCSRPGATSRRAGQVLTGLATAAAAAQLTMAVMANTMPSPYVALALLTLAAATILTRPALTRPVNSSARPPGRPAADEPAADEPAADRPAADRPADQEASADSDPPGSPPPAGGHQPATDPAAGGQPTSQQAAVDRERFADTLLQSMNEAVMVLDANYRVLDVNRRWRELTGHRVEDVVGRQPPFPWDGDPGPGDRVLQRVDGTDIPVLATMAPVPDATGQTHAYVATYVDIADRKHAEETLAAHAAELEQSNSQLRDANHRLETALAFKSDLMSMLSHDVSQPISSIASLSELLISDWADLPEDVRLELATKIDKNTQRLIRMMNDLSLLFRLDTGSVTAHRAPVPVRQVAETVTTALAAEGVEILVDAHVSVLADRGHLWHVVHNLVSNAIAYGSPPVEIRATRTEDRVVLLVQDRGSGIPPELVPNLFDRFMRGSGLGLFIVRHLVEANGGTVHHEPAEPHGTRLVVSLEAAIPGAAGTGDPD